MKKVFSTIKSFLKETDILLFSLCVITSAFGLLMVYSATRYTLKDGAHFSREFIIMLLAISSESLLRCSYHISITKYIPSFGRL